MLDNLLHMMAWIYGLGFLAAAPVGPVNMYAIQRGVLGKWSHTLCMGIGSAMVDLTFFALAIWGGQYLSEYLRDPNIQDIVAAVSAGVLVPLGIRFLRRARRLTLADLMRTRRRRRNRLPRHLWTDVGTGIGLTVINPAVPAYWLAVSAPWLAAAQSTMGQTAIWWGLAGAGAGLMTWFCLITFLVRFTPNRLGPAFFRVVNGICGVMLLGFAAFCLQVVISHRWPG
jgi:threonine/homoserine/homoserine lactone efflux protein